MSDSAGHPRPRPKYGEYATPQEQAEIVARSMPPVSPVLVPHDESVPVPSGIVDPAASTGPRAEAPTAPASVKPRRRWDLVVSIALLTYGLFTVLAAFAQYSNIPALMNQVYETQSMGTFTSTDLSRGLGIVIIIVNVVLYALTAWLTVRHLIARRIAFWIPLSGGILAALLTGVALAVLIVGDPAFQEFAGMRS